MTERVHDWGLMNQLKLNAVEKKRLGCYLDWGMEVRKENGGSVSVFFSQRKYCKILNSRIKKAIPKTVIFKDKSIEK